MSLDAAARFLRSPAPGDMRIATVTRVFLCAGLIPAIAAADPCTRHDASAVRRTVHAALTCRANALGFSTRRCVVASPPGCAASLVRDAVALAYGGASPTAAGLARPIACQRAIGRAVGRFVDARLDGRAAPRFASLRACRGVRVLADGSNGAVPAVGPPCAAAVGGPGSVVQRHRLRRCLRAVLETWVARVVPTRAASPNLILVVTDDQRWDTLGYMPIVQAELAGKGVLFSNAFVTTPLCCPSRASILTGQYAHTTGVRDNLPPLGGVQAFDDRVTLATRLEAAGYRTALVGKYMNGYPQLPRYVPPGWSEWYAFAGAEAFYDYLLIENGVGSAYGANDADYATDVLAAKAVRFITEDDSSRPFFLYFAPNAPHFPATPAPRHLGRFADLAAWRPPAFAEADVSDKPAWIQALPFSPYEQAFTDAFRTGQLASLLAVDEAIGAILQAVRDTGRERDTVVVFTSDNGHLWGEHRFLGKACPYEEAIRVPLVVRAPGLAPLAREDARFVLNIDLAPTLLELAGVTVAPAVEGQSLVRALDATEHDWRSDFLIEGWHGPFTPTPDFAGVRDERWKYVEYASGESELYDLAADPDELASRHTDPSTESVRGELGRRLRELRPDWAR